VPNKSSFRNAEQRTRVNQFLLELKSEFEQYKKAAAVEFPETPGPFEATEANMRESLLAQRTILMNIRIPLTLMVSTLEQIARVWPEGKKPVAKLIDWAKIGIRIHDNLIEENLLWENPDPMGSSVSFRRRAIFADNRRLGEKANKKLIEGAQDLHQLTDVNILDWVI
jgi:hypothetical protein